VIEDHTATLHDQPVFWRSAPGGDPPVLYLHGVPTSSDDWTAFLARTGGLAPDLPGFGRSGKRGDGDFTMEGYAGWLEDFLDLAEADRVRLVVHDWGAIGLLWAMRSPERVERLVIMNAVAFLPGYRWHRAARAWRTPLVGELVMGATTRFALRRAMGRALADQAWAHFDQGTQRAILRLYRSSPPEKLAAAGRGLSALTCPALIVWGDDDPYLAPRFAEGYAASLGGEAEVVHLPGTGHWPWTDRPELIDRVAAFLDG